MVYTFLILFLHYIFMFSSLLTIGTTLDIGVLVRCGIQPDFYMSVDVMRHGIKLLIKL